MQTTISDIAREAGVSTATVSRVLNGNTNVTEETRIRVQKAMEEFNYSPSFIARGLKNKSMKTIAVVVKKMTIFHHMRIASEINEHFTNMGFDVVVYEAGSSAESIGKFLRRMVDRSIDGIVFIGSAFETLTAYGTSLKETIGKIPVVIANGWIEGTYGILVDEKGGSVKLVEHLHSTGRDNMVYIQNGNTSSSYNKLTGFLSAVDALSLGETCSHVVVPEGYEELKKTIVGLDIKGNGINGLLCEDDMLAAKVIKALGEEGISVPGDVSVTGFNDSVFAEVAAPSITTIDNKANEQGRLCAEVLEKLLSEKNREQESKTVLLTLETNLIIRESTKVPTV